MGSASKRSRNRSSSCHTPRSVAVNFWRSMIMGEKHQTLISKHQTSSKSQTSTCASGARGVCRLVFVWCLEIGVWRLLFGVSYQLPLFHSQVLRDHIHGQALA